MVTPVQNDHTRNAGHTEVSTQVPGHLDRLQVGVLHDGECSEAPRLPAGGRPPLSVAHESGEVPQLDDGQLRQEVQEVKEADPERL